METLGKIIRTLYKKHKITQEALAEKAGISPHYLNEIINNKRPDVSFRVIRDIAKALGESMATLAAEKPANIEPYPAGFKEHIDLIVEIFESEDRESIEALKSNILAFYSSTRAKRKVSKLEQEQIRANERIASLEKALGSLDPPTEQKETGRGQK